MKYFERIWTGKTRKAARSTLAGTLAVAMLLPTMTGVRAVAAGLPGVSEGALGIVQAIDQEKPTIEIRANAVIDSRGQLTGYLEVGLWVKTPTVYYNDAGEVVTNVPDTVKPDDESTWDAAGIKTAKPQTFSSLGVSLKYNADILTPVAWEGQNEKGEALFGKDLEVKLAAGGQVNLPAKKADEGTTAAAAISHNPVTSGTETSKTGMLYFMVEATNGEAVLPDGTLLGVVRFYYDKEKFEPWATESGKTGKATVGGVKNEVTDVSNWFAMIGDHWLIQYASEGEILKVITDPSSTIMFSFAGQQVYYISGTNEFYWSEKLDKSECKVVDAIDSENPTDKTKNSLTTNLLRKLNSGVTGEPAEGDYTPCVSFKLVNSLSFAQGGGGDQAIIVYYDWDNALIGVQGVEPGDARKEVNDFVEKNFIATDVRASKYTVNTADYYDAIDSVKRIDTYRDETYPAEGPGGSTYDANGDSFQLTNKLDYAFYTHPTKMTVLADPDGSWSGTPVATPGSSGLTEKAGGGELNGDETIQWEPMKAADWAAKADLDQGAVQYPYTNGWAVVPEEKVHSNNVDDVWTTMGGYRGELVDCKPVPVNNDNCDIPANANGFRNYTTSGESSYFHFQDFSELEKDKVYYVKACYEPGERLDYTTYQYSPVSDDVYYVRYGTGDSTIANAYSMQFAYRRMNASGYGVPRTRKPAIRVAYYPDYNETRASYTNSTSSLFYGRSNVTNTDIVDVEITVAASIYRANYVLIDEYGKDYVSGFVSSYNNEANSEVPLLTNFEYIGDTNGDGKDDGYDQRQGTEGFVFRGTLQQILEAGLQEVKNSGSSNFTAVLNANAFKDLHLMNAKGGNITTATLGAPRNAILSAIRDAYEHGGEAKALSLDWHQLQYAIETYNSASKTSDLLNGSVIRSPAQCIALHSTSAGTPGFTWCRIDDCASGGGAGAITDLKELVQGAVDENSSVSGALDGLVDMFHFRQSAKGEAYADVDTFKTAVKKAVADLITNSGGKFTSANIADTITWKQLQYALDHPGTDCYKPDAEVATNCDYWWEPDSAGIEGKKEISDLGTLLDVVNKVENLSYDPSWLSELDVGLADTLKLWTKADKDDHKFANTATFQTSIKNAIGRLKPTYTDETLKGAPWIEVQHLLIDTANMYQTKMYLEENGYKLTYWWGYDTEADAPIIATLPDLLTAAEQAYKGAQHTWDKLDENILKNLKLAKSDPGGAEGQTFETEGALVLFGSEDLADFKANMEKLLVAAEGQTTPVAAKDLTWKQVQHAVMNGGEYKADDEISDKTLWWNTGKGTRPGSLNTLEKLLAAAKASAWDDLTLSDVTSQHFVLKDKDNPKTGDTFADLPQVTEGDLGTFRDRMERMTQEIGYADPTWKMVAYYLLYQEFKLDADIPEDTPDGIWFNEKGEGVRPGELVVYDPDGAAEAVLQEAERISNWWGGDGDKTTLKQMLKEKIDDLGFKKDSAGNQAYTTSESDLEEMATKLYDMIDKANSLDEETMKDYLDSDYRTIMTWEQVQHYLIYGELKKNEEIGEFAWKPTSSGGEVDPPTPPVVVYDPDGAAEAVLQEAERISNWWGGDGDKTTLKQMLKEKIDDLGFKKDSAGNQAYTTSESDLEEMATKLYDMIDKANSLDEETMKDYLDSDYRTIMTWEQVQHYLIYGELKKNEEIGTFTWKPNSGGTLDLFDSLVETFQSIMSRTENSETTTEAETSYDAETGDVTVKTTSTTVMTIILTIGEKKLRIEKTFVVENTTFVDGSTYQATTTTRTWEEKTKVLTPLEELLPTETPEATQVPGTEETQEPGTDEKADTPVETTEPELEEESPTPEASQKPTETTDLETSETPTETPDPEVSQKPAETPTPTESETQPSTQTQDPDLTTEPEEQEKTPTEEGTGAAEETQTPKNEETPAPTDQADDVSTQPPEDETAEVLAIAWLLPPETPASYASQVSSVRRC